jgi:hypothetical protein
MLGKIVYTTNLDTDADGAIRIAMESPLQKGLYILQVIAEGRITQKKVIVR